MQNRMTHHQSDKKFKNERNYLNGNRIRSGNNKEQYTGKNKVPSRTTKSVVHNSYANGSDIDKKSAPGEYEGYPEEGDDLIFREVKKF